MQATTIPIVRTIEEPIIKGLLLLYSDPSALTAPIEEPIEKRLLLIDSDRVDRRAHEAVFRSIDRRAHDVATVIPIDSIEEPMRGYDSDHIDRRAHEGANTTIEFRSSDRRAHGGCCY
jgi:hypothetical protein